MHYTLHFCKKPHPATRVTNHPPISPNLYRVVLDVTGPGYTTTYAVCAYVEGQIIGVFRFNVIGKTLKAEGTTVVKKYRGLGIASKMWDVAIRRFSPKTIKVATISYAGESLVAKKQTQYKGKIRFNVVG